MTHEEVPPEVWRSVRSVTDIPAPRPTPPEEADPDWERHGNYEIHFEPPRSRT